MASVAPLWRVVLDESMIHCHKLFARAAGSHGAIRFAILGAVLRDETVFKIADERAELGLLVGVMVLRDITIAESPSDLRRSIQSSAGEVRHRFSDVAAIREAAEVQAFRRIYEAVGVNPNRHAPA